MYVPAERPLVAAYAQVAQPWAAVGLSDAQEPQRAAVALASGAAAGPQPAAEGSGAAVALLRAAA